MRPFCEVCCPSFDAVRKAVAAGADRIELCDRLEVGGVTPSEGLIRDSLAVARLASVPVNVLIRPREGGFIYDDEEVSQMLDAISMCKRLGVNGVVVGALLPDGAVDMDLMRRLVDAARPLCITFHRAFDECSDVFAALEDIISLGIDRILTSGHCATAWEGRFVLQDLVTRAAGRIVIMPGCGITPENLPKIASVTGAAEFHGSRILFLI
ncbi:MAG: copper homeostasis protein CutC [Bacteroidales bacterium]|nr:copper homeostasis protein CutC [Bacteroidales bacterium]